MLKYVGLFILLPVAALAITPEEKEASDICIAQRAFFCCRDGGGDNIGYNKGFEICTKLMPVIDLKVANEKKSKDDADSKRIAVLAAKIGGKLCDDGK